MNYLNWSNKTFSDSIHSIGKVGLDDPDDEVGWCRSLVLFPVCSFCCTFAAMTTIETRMRETHTTPRLPVDDTQGSRHRALRTSSRPPSVRWSGKTRSTGRSTRRGTVHARRRREPCGHRGVGGRRELVAAARKLFVMFYPFFGFRTLINYS